MYNFRDELTDISAKKEAVVQVIKHESVDGMFQELFLYPKVLLPIEVFFQN